MAKNSIPEIARMLGVEIGEEFKRKEVVGLAYKFDDKGLRLIYDNHMAIFVTEMLLPRSYKTIGESWNL